MSFSFAFGAPIAAEAVRRGATPGNARSPCSRSRSRRVPRQRGLLRSTCSEEEPKLERRGPGGRNALLACAGGALWLFGFYF